MLRNPVDLVYSFHQEMVYTGLENVSDFKAAWCLQDERKAGRSLPSNCKVPNLLQYRDVGSLGDQLERFYESFPVDRLFVRTVDDLRYGERLIQDLEEFLGLPKSGLRVVPEKNESKTVRYPWLDAFLLPPDWAKNAADRVKETLGVRRLGAGLALRWIRETCNTKVVSRPALSPVMREELKDYFRPQVRKLEGLTGRDFSAWT